MERTSFAEMQCCLARGLEMIGDWWSPLIIRDLFLNVRRFEEIVEDLGISRNLLSRRLKFLVEKGIVERSAYQHAPIRHEYRLSEAGRDFVPVVLALTAWGERWARPKEGSPVFFRHRSCGELFQPQVSCSACNKPIAARDLIVIGGPGGAARAGTKLIAKRLKAGPISGASN